MAALESQIPSSAESPSFVLDCRGIRLDCTPPHSAGAVVMGILNVTPDSFSDGGRFDNPDSALFRAEEMLLEGARIIDVGGESSRPRGATYGPGATAVGEEEEMRRVGPVVRAVVREFPDAIVSVDTYKPAVVHAALDLGAHMINDVTALRYHPETAGLVAAAGAAIVLMHSVGKPGEMPQEHRYKDVVREVGSSLDDSVRIARAAGVRSIALDPGFGFGKRVDENFHLLSRIDRLVSRGMPVLIGVSRKSSIGIALSDEDSEPVSVEARLFGSLGATAVAVTKGATIVRTHDVKPTVEMLRVLARAMQESEI